MSLPTALAAKLSKRGLIADTGKLSEYDNHTNYKGILGCPNKNNIYHECTNWCQIHWKGILTPDQSYARRVKKMLEKYPLPNNWTEVFDKGLGKYYYWNMETDMVSWLPPKHPKSVSSECAAKLRMKLHLPQKEITSEKESERKKDHRDRHHRDRRDRDKDDDKRRHEDKDRNRKKPRNDDLLDPMDPAAYSDIPKGTWSDGLDNNKSSKADSTASGALYQQRPYPSPGEVLNSNKQKTKRTRDS